MCFEKAMETVLNELTKEYEIALCDEQKKFDTFDIWQYNYKRSKALYQDLIIIRNFVDRVKQTMESKI